MIRLMANLLPLLLKKQFFTVNFFYDRLLRKKIFNDNNEIAVRQKLSEAEI